MMKKKKVQMWVHPDFKETMGINSSIRNVDMITLTKELSERESIKKKNKGFQFGF